MVTFLFFVAPAIDLLSGAQPRPLPFLKATLAEPTERKARHDPLPARQRPVAQWLTRSPPAFTWQSSGDTVTMAQANCYLVSRPRGRKRFPPVILLTCSCARMSRNSCLANLTHSHEEALPLHQIRRRQNGGRLRQSRHHPHRHCPRPGKNEARASSAP